VNYKFGMLPFSKGTLKITMLLILFVLGFYFWEFPFSGYLNIILKSLLIAVLYAISIYMLKVSHDISSVFDKYLKRR
jgi:hypothetical protein